jgi:hypothetical protein
MLPVGLFLLLLAGFALIWRISRNFGIWEDIGYGMLAGAGLATFLMFFFDVLSIPITASSLSIGLLLTTTVCFLSVRPMGEAWKQWSMKLNIKAADIQLPALFLMLLLGWLVYVVSVKCLFWPPAEHDTIGSFDKLGRVIALEGKLKVSLFDYHVEGAGGVYPPLLHGSYAYAYLFGAETSKLMNTWFYLALIISFFGISVRLCNQTLAALLCLTFALAPELYAHAALTLGNMPAAAYTAIALMALGVWREGEKGEYLFLSAIMMGMTLWIRGDTIVFLPAAFVLFLPAVIEKRMFRKIAVAVFLMILPFVLWNLYLKFKLETGQGGRFSFDQGYQAEKFNLMWGYLKAMLFGGTYGKIDGGQLYGVTFYVFYLSLFASLTLLLFKKVNFSLSAFAPTAAFCVSLAAYFAVFYFIDEKKQAAPIDSLMSSSFKRGLFGFLPFALFAAIQLPAGQLFSRFLDRFMGVKA